MNRIHNSNIKDEKSLIILPDREITKIRKELYAVLSEEFEDFNFESYAYGSETDPELDKVFNNNENINSSKKGAAEISKTEIDMIFKNLKKLSAESKVNKIKKNKNKIKVNKIKKNTYKKTIKVTKTRKKYKKRRAECQCNLCPKRFRNLVKLTRHYKGIHNENRRHHCSMCNFRFNYVSHLKRHQQNQH